MFNNIKEWKETILIKQESKKKDEHILTDYQRILQGKR